MGVHRIVRVVSGTEEPNGIKKFAHTPAFHLSAFAS